jgi:Ca-activated chloride channel family protein
VRLHDPWLLVLLALVPLCVRALARAPRAALRFPVLASAVAQGRGRRTRLRALPALLRVAALVLLVFAIARPQLGRSQTEVRAEGIDIMLAVDVSSSMLAEDFAIEGERANRLDAVKAEVRRFLAKRTDDRAGLVLFAARPYLQAPLTLDHDWLLANLERAEVGMIEDGTAVGSALASAVRHLEGSEGKSKVVVLLTDGESNAGRISPLTAADAAKSLGYKVYTIGAGSHGLAPYPVVDAFGNRRYRPMEVDIDEETLREIASRTGGRYWRATGTESLAEVYAEIDRLEKTEHEGLRSMEYDELYAWLLAPALLLLALEAVLSETWLRVLP